MISSIYTWLRAANSAIADSPAAFYTNFYGKDIESSGQSDRLETCPFRGHNGSFTINDDGVPVLSN